jgi:hypothetical protein
VKRELRERLRLIIGSASWSALISGIILAKLYTSPSLSSTDWTLIFLASVFAGVVLEALENIIIGFGVTIISSSLIVAFSLSLPSFLGLAGSFGDFAIESALATLVQAMFPFTVILILLGGSLGGFLAGKLGLD